jgi:hypothetical protein
MNARWWNEILCGQDFAGARNTVESFLGRIKRETSSHSNAHGCYCLGIADRGWLREKERGGSAASGARTGGKGHDAFEYHFNNTHSRHK